MPSLTNILIGSTPGRRAARFQIVPLVAVAVASGWFPLVCDLHYEYAALMALVCSLTSGLGMLLFRPPPPPEPAAAWRRLPGTLAVAAVPLAFGIVRAVAGAYCGLAEGALWYALLVPVSCLCSVALATVAARLTPRRWLRVLLFMLLWSPGLVRGAWEALTGPHIFMYCWHIGFFPGGSWDAELPITTTLVAYRFVHLLAALCLITVVEWSREAPAFGRLATTRRTALAGIGLFAALCAVAALNRPDLGLTRTDQWLHTQLPDSVRTRFAVIRFNRPDIDTLTLWRTAHYTDFYIHNYAAALGVPEDSVDLVTVNLYATPDEQKQLVGTSSATFTKPWLRTVNIAAGRVTANLKHELAHIMMAPYGNPLGISDAQGLLEGSAMALEDNPCWRSLYQDAWLLRRHQMAPAVSDLMSLGGFSGHQGSLSYVLCGSFSKWLINTYGIQSYKHAFPWSDFRRAYGLSLDSLSKLYEQFLAGYFKDARGLGTGRGDGYDAVALRYLYGGGSFFAQRCLRRIGTLNARAAQALGGEQFAKALDLYAESLRQGITYTAREGVLRSLYGAGRFRQMLDSAAVYDRDTASYPLLPLLAEKGDACWALGDAANALRCYDSLTALGISSGITLRCGLRRTFISVPDTVLRNLMRTYFTRPLGTVQRVVVLGQAMDRVRDQMRQKPETGPKREGDDTQRELLVVLALMKASLTAQRSPELTMQALKNDLTPAMALWLNDTASLYKAGRYTARDGFDGQYGSVLGILTHGLMDMYLYAQGAGVYKGAQDGIGGEFSGERFREGKRYTLDDRDRAIAGLFFRWETRPALMDSREELPEFDRYVRDHPLKIFD